MVDRVGKGKSGRGDGKKLLRIVSLRTQHAHVSIKIQKKKNCCWLLEFYPHGAC